LGLSVQTPSTSALRQLQGLPDGNNWARGGYTTQQIFDSITAVGGSVTTASAPLPARVRDGYLVGRVADPNALYYINGGGNDFLQGLVLSPADALAAAGRLGNSMRALQGAGARYIMTPLLVDVLSPSTNQLTPVQQ